MLPETYTAAQGFLDTLFGQLDAGTMTVQELIEGLPESMFLLLTRPSLRLTGEEALLGKGVIISQGAVAGRVYASLERLLAEPSTEPKILVCDRLRNTDLCHFTAIHGVLSSREDPSSHAAIVSRVNGKPVLAGLA